MPTVPDPRLFVDTNILYYANDLNAQFGQQAADRIVRKDMC